ncbi:MAG: ClpX C4-type zinc finger protein [Acidimicrobiia bacterium]
MARVSCSFCGKGEDEVPHLVRGPRRVAICAECIDLCARVNEAASPFEGDVLLTDVGTLVTNDRFVEGILGAIPDGAVAVEKGLVRWAGPERAMPDRFRDLPTVACGQRVVLPGLVDAHGPTPGAERLDEGWHEALAAGTTTLASVCPPHLVERTLAAAIDAVAEVGLLVDGWAGPLPRGPVRSVGEPGRDVDWVRVTGDADAVAAVAASERTDPRGYLAERFDDRSTAALAATRRAVVALPTGALAGGSLRQLWRTTSVGLGSGGTTHYGANASMAVSMWLAVRDLGLRLEEALWSATRGSAIAMDWGERGHLVRGAVGDLVIVDTDRLDDLGTLGWRPWRVFRAGVEV